MGFALLAGGCAITDARRTAPIGAPTGPATLGQITPGETTAGWVLAVLGEPDAIEPAATDPVAGEPATLIYRSGTVRTGGGNLLVFSAATGVEDAVETRIAVSGGRVTGIQRADADRRLTPLERASIDLDFEPDVGSDVAPDADVDAGPDLDPDPATEIELAAGDREDIGRADDSDD